MKLYYENPYMTEFKATVTGCEKAKSGYAITLNQTAFYPEGGGQPFDTGFIGDIKVTAVHERAGVILHYAEEALVEGTACECKIDWERRFPLMQEHTGEHILSGIIKQHFGFSNVGFHMGSEFVTIDIDGLLTEEQLQFAEKLANKAVYENLSVETGFKSESELMEINYRSKGNVQGEVRIVRIGDYDTCACCGVHCRSTGEVGLVKIIGSQKYKSGMRIFLLCGIRAFEDYSSKNRSVRDISVMLSVKTGEISKAVGQLLEENANLGITLNGFKNQMISQIADKITENSSCVCLFEDGLNADDLRKLCLLITERAELAAVFSRISVEETSYKYAIGSKTHDVRQITAKLNAAFSGRGGGKKELTQGSLTGERESVEAIINNEFNYLR